MRLKWLGIDCVRIVQHERGAPGAVARAHRNAPCRVLSEDEALAFAVDPELELDEAWIRAAYQRGAACVGAVEGGRLLGYAWLAFCDTPHACGVWLELGPGVRYLHHPFVRPGYRARRIIQALHAHAERPELWRGRRVCLSLGGAGRPAARSLGHVVYAKVFGRVLAWHSAGVRRAGLRFRAPPAPPIADTMQAWPDQSPRSSA